MTDHRVSLVRRHPVRTVVATLLLLLVLVVGLYAEQYVGAPEAGEECTIKELRAPTASGTAVGDQLAEAHPRWLTQVRGTVNDASCLNRTWVYGVATPRDVEDVQRALRCQRGTRRNPFTLLIGMEARPRRDKFPDDNVLF